jgi:uncharacterized membrane protein YjjP (DUF1212 family)
VPSEQEDHDVTATQFVAAYGLDNQVLALPNYVQVGSATGDGLFIVNPDVDLRCDQSFPLAQLVAQARTCEISPEEGIAELDRIHKQQRRFPLWIAVLGYAVQSTGLTLIICALAISHRLGTPPTVSLVLLGFWLLVAGAAAVAGGHPVDRVAKPESTP